MYCSIAVGNVVLKIHYTKVTVICNMQFLLGQDGMHKYIYMNLPHDIILLLFGNGLKRNLYTRNFKIPASNVTV